MATKTALTRFNAVAPFCCRPRDNTGLRSIYVPYLQQPRHISSLLRSPSIRPRRPTNDGPLSKPTKCPSWGTHRLHTSSQTWSSQRAEFLDRIPPNSWDSHMHIVDPSSYPLSSNAQYTPTPHTLSQALQFYSSIGIYNLVFVQPSIYGNDNSCMLSALRELGPSRGRAVVTFDPATIKLSTLQEWHATGVRGVRVNLVSVGKEMVGAELAMTLKQYADMIRPLDWVLQLYVPLKMATDLQDIVPMLGVKVCLDHFGQPTLPAPSAREAFSKTSDPYDVPGFSSMIELLQRRDTFVKLSAPYRISKHEEYFDLEPMAREILRIAGMTNVVFATDWPHTRFEGLDIRPFIQRVIEWCGRDEKLIDRLFRGNAEQLWGVKR